MEAGGGRRARGDRETTEARLGSAVHPARGRVAGGLAEVAVEEELPLQAACARKEEAPAGHGERRWAEAPAGRSDAPSAKRRWTDQLPQSHGQLASHVLWCEAARTAKGVVQLLEVAEAAADDDGRAAGALSAKPRLHHIPRLARGVNLEAGDCDSASVRVVIVVAVVLGEEDRGRSHRMSSRSAFSSLPRTPRLDLLGQQLVRQVLSMA